MGGCLSSQQERSPSNTESSDGGTTQQGVSIGKNQPLKHERIRWKSDVPLTEGQLRSKRDEFWDTAPAFEGRKEIWDALKAASYAAETCDYTLAQAIVNGASISLPNGTLTDCYDELGNRYQLPVYCLSSAINMLEDTNDAIDATSKESSSNVGTAGAQVHIRVRISTDNSDLKITLRTLDTILFAKQHVHSIVGIEPSNQRWFFGGRLLYDKLTIEEAKIPAMCVVQVIVSQLDGKISPSIES
ncbi:Ubiquitin domain-containing protein 2 [Nymphon striatum]|nr:Ubiquitin domain-containing protein 2 [Nymphon striatum]